MPIYITDFLLLGGEDAAGYESTPNSPRIGIQNSASRATIFASPSELPTNPAWLTSTPSTAERWKTSSDNYHLWVANVNDAVCDYIGIAAMKGTFGSQIDVKVVIDGVLTQVYGPAIIIDESPIFIMFEPGEVGAVAITFTSDTAFSLEVGNIHVGKSVFLPRNIYVGHTPINYGRQPQTEFSISDNSNFLGQVNTGVTLRSSVDMKNIPPAFYRELLYPKFHIPSETSPFFWAWRPQSYPNEVGFCWLTSPMSVANDMSNGYMSINFAMMGFLNNGG